MSKKDSNPFFTKGNEMGSFEAGSGETMVRKADDPPVDPFLAELRALHAELATSQAEVIRLLTVIAKNTGPKPNPPKRNPGGM